MTLEEFKSQVKDIARPNRFRINVITPFGNLPQKGIFLCQAAGIPSHTVTPITLNYQGHKIKIGGDYEEEALTITFLNDYDFVARKFFENWIRKIASNREYSVPSEYLNSTIILEQLGRKFETLRTYKFHYCVPTNISTIDLSMESNDTLETFTVTVEYSYWEAE